MGFGSFLGGIAGDVVGGIGNFFGAKETANSARDVAAQQVASTREQMAFQDKQGGIQRDFEERMSNSAYQRATADMKAAGINPMVAYQQGGAGTPSVTAQPGSSVGSLPVPQSPWSSLGNLGTSARDTMRLLQDMNESNSRIKLNSNLGEKALADAGLARTNAGRGSADEFISNLKKRFLENIVGGAKNLWRKTESDEQDWHFRNDKLPWYERSNR